MPREHAPNRFQAKPEKFFGSQMRGTIEVPGFHTASSMDTTIPYAQGKVQDMVPSDREGLKTPIDDYPVIIEIDMRGLNAEPDYDVLNVGLEAVEELLKNFDGETVDDLREYLDFSDEEQETPEGVMDALFTLYGGMSVSEAQRSYLSHLESIGEAEGREKADEILQSDKKNGPDMKYLLPALGQFKYSQDVDDQRIQRVYYMKPFFDRLFPHFDDPEFTKGVEKTIEKAEAAGYRTISLEDVYASMNPAVVEAVWENRGAGGFHESQKFFEFYDGKPRLEFHGTSYRNLVSAAPWLKAVLPVPPPPYGETT